MTKKRNQRGLRFMIRKKRVRICYLTLLGKAAQTNKHKNAEEVLEKELRKQKE